MTWRVEVWLYTGAADYARALKKVLEHAEIEVEPEVSPASQIVVLNSISKNHARTVVDWTMDFWSAASRVEARKNLREDGGDEDTPSEPWTLEGGR